MKKKYNLINFKKIFTYKFYYFFLLENEENIHSWNDFTEFYVDYTSSLAVTTPVYGSLRGDIESINGNNITLKNRVFIN